MYICNMEETTREIGGSPFLLKMGQRFNRWGENLTKRGTRTVISNPTARLLGPFVLKIDFTVDTTKKYQLVIQGDYKSRYKDFGTEESPLTTNEMFMLIVQSQNKWYLKT